MISSREIVVLIAEGDVRWDIADIIDAVKGVLDENYHTFDVLKVLEKAKQDNFFQHLRDSLTGTGNEMIREYVEGVLNNEKEKDS